MATPITKREFMLYGGAAAALLGSAASVLAATTPEEGQSHMETSENHLVLREADNLSTETVISWLKALRGRPFVEQSGFDVTAIFKVKSGGKTYYVGGVNVENTELAVGSCGEEGAIASAATALGQDIDIVEGWVMGAPRGMETGDIAVYPCGECRQRIAQYTAPTAPIHMVTLSGEVADTKTRDELLPHAFSFRDLEHNGMVGDIPELAAVPTISDRLFRTPKAPLDKDAIFNWLTGLKSDVRVSRLCETVVLRLDNGAYTAGVKVENAAYPSSTGAVQGACAVMNARFGRRVVEEVWAIGQHRDAEKAAQHAGMYHPISGAGLQILHQFASDGAMPVHVFNSEGSLETAALSDRLAQVRRF